MTTAANPLPPHGTYARARGNHRSGQNRCRCYPCRAAEAAYTKRRRYLQIAGKPLLTDTAPVAAHLRNLTNQGDALSGIAERLSVPRSVIYNIISGKTRRVRSATADRILAIRPGTAPNRSRSVPAIGAIRRIRALTALGHPLLTISEAAPMEKSTASHLLNGHPTTISYELAERVDQTYRQLCTTRGNSVRSLRRAAREQWAPPAAWDDDAIDDPAATPDTGTPDTELGRDELAAYRKAEIAHLAAYGIPEHEIADRLGMTVGYVHDLLVAFRKQQIGTAA